jgi:hypothetical protein
MLKEEIVIRITEGKESALPYKTILEKKFLRTVSVCKNFKLNVNSDKCVVMKISQRNG